MNDFPIYDAHCHIFPEKIAEKATRAIGSFYDIPMQSRGSAPVLREEANNGGIAKCLVCSTATTPAQVSSINAFIAETCRQYTPLFFGFGTLHQDLSENELCAEIDRILALGLHGIKLHPEFQRLYADDPHMMAAYAYAAEKNLPILFHVGDDRYDYSSPERILHIAKALPHLRIMAAHLGGYRVWEQSPLLAPCENIVVDCSSSLEFLSPAQARQLISQFGTQRVLFGSDFPMWKPADVVALVQRLSLGSNAEEQIFSRNFAAYFSL